MFISGAFAIFVSSGVSFRKALCLLSTFYLFSYVGVVVGAILGTSLNLTVWIFAVIAGMFLYIALAEMVSGTYSCFQPPTLSLPSSGDVPSPIRNLATTTATATRTFKNQYVYTIPDRQVSLVKMKPFPYSRNVLVQKPI